ncbi:MAG: 1-acyl-sn-glycerol-3-phosphate acyltransferase [Bacteroidota bacterium]
MNSTKTETYKDLIDIKGILHLKVPIFYRLIPRFILRYFQKILHEKDINGALFRNRNLSGIDFVDAILLEFGANITVTGLENIEPDKRFIVVSNHPLGGLDGLALMSVIGRVRRDIVFPVNDFLLNLPNLKELFVPLNKVGKNNSGNSELLNSTFASNKMLLYFPAGLVSRNQKGTIKDLEWKKTFVNKAIQYQRDVIPVHIDGKNSNFFYRLANLRKIAGIRFNIEMLYLVDEMYKQKNKNIRITIGKPIPFSTFSKEHKPIEWANKIKKIVYSLPEKSNNI